MSKGRIIDGGSVALQPHFPGIWRAHKDRSLPKDVVKWLKGLYLMGALTDFGENALLRTIAGTAYSITTSYVGLFITAPGESTGGTEVSGGSYARQPRSGIGAAATNYNAPVAGEPSVMDNFAEILYPTATANWGSGSPVAAAAIHDALTAGNIVMFGALTASKLVNSGDTFKFNAGALDLGLG